MLFVWESAIGNRAGEDQLAVWPWGAVSVEPTLQTTTNGQGLLNRGEGGGVVRADAWAEDEDLFRSLIESSPDVFFRLGATGKVVYLSPAGRALFACAASSGRGHQYLDSIPAAGKERAEKAFQQILSGAGPREVLLEMVRPDGQLLQAAVQAGPWHDRNRLRGVQGSLRPLVAAEIGEPSSSLLQAPSRPGEHAPGGEEAVARAWEQLGKVPVPLCLLSLQCRVLRVNRAFGDFFGCRGEDLIGQTGQALWGGAACETAACPLRRLASGTAPSSLEVEACILGRPLACTLHAAPFVDAGGGMRALIITFGDGRERKKISLELLRTQQQLIEAEKLSAIGSLAGSLAHEFNNPLCGVRSVVERMARLSGLAPADQGLLGLALEECDRMARLIKDLQQFNLPYSDVRQTFDLHRAIDSVLVLLNNHLKGRKAKVRRQYAGAPLSLVGVENQIKQVLLNLLKNCSEALPATGGSITIETKREGDRVSIVLADTGVGISAEHLPHLFEPFFTTKAAVKAVGLGLAVSSGIIKGHGGDIRVESLQGMGTTFTVVLPAGEFCEQQRG